MQHFDHQLNQIVLFRIEEGSNGVDDTFNVVCVRTGAVLAWFGYWDERSRALREAKKFKRAMERACHHAEINAEGFAKSLDHINRSVYAPITF